MRGSIGERRTGAKNPSERRVRIPFNPRWQAPGHEQNCPLKGDDVNVLNPIIRIFSLALCKIGYHDWDAPGLDYQECLVCGKPRWRRRQ